MPGTVANREPRDVPSPGGGFRTTCWTAVLDTARAGGGGQGEAFARLYRDYWPPLLTYVRRRGHSPADAEDLTQGFFHHLLQGSPFARLQRHGGRFRSYLLASLDHYLAHDWHRRRRAKRGGGWTRVDLDADGAEARIPRELVDTESPESAYERQWVVTLLDLVLERLAGESDRAGRAAFFRDVRDRLQGDLLGAPYAEVAARHGMTEGAVKVAVHRLRARFGELLREELARTIDGESGVEEELRHLLSVASS